MRPPRFRVRTLMFAAWLSALLLAGVVDVIDENRSQNRIEVVDEHVSAEGSTSITLQQSRRVYYLGPVPIGPYSKAPLCGAAFAASVVAWAIRRRRDGDTRSGDASEAPSTSGADRA